MNGRRGPGPDEAQRIADALADLLDEVVFNIEHGVPEAELRKLEDLGERIATQATTAASDRFTDVLRTFRKSVSGMRASDPDAPDELLASGRRIIAILRGSG
jgi:hypothetical protein